MFLLSHLSFKTFYIVAVLLTFSIGTVRLDLAEVHLPFEIFCQDRVPCDRQDEKMRGCLHPISRATPTARDDFCEANAIVPRFDYGKTNIRLLLMFHMWAIVGLDIQL